ncbi:hypothetical protein T01_13531 [Trichinella spiralis]|uniref:Uncharacterized protein n=1 Tax=Trichinella spiralis TaxID=6334 RepID=A0A0V1BJ05_TRISP|nr:hypothetical protein T01_13531 [Trichinella spiralis]
MLLKSEKNYGMFSEVHDFDAGNSTNTNYDKLQMKCFPQSKHPDSATYQLIIDIFSLVNVFIAMTHSHR